MREAQELAEKISIGNAPDACEQAVRFPADADQKP